MIEVLGDVRVRHDGQATAIGSRSQRLVLAVLAAHVNRVVPAETLIDALWEEDPPETARRTLGSYVSRLRALLGDTIEIGHGGYRLVASEESLDSLRFEHALRVAAAAHAPPAADMLGAALAEVGGRPFGEFADIDSVRGAAMRLESLILDARDRRAAALLSAGRASDAAAAASEILADHPLRETAWIVLVDAQARSSPGDALRTFRRAVDTLAEVGLVPSDALRNAEARALRVDATDDGVGQRDGRSRGRSTLIGRDDALVELSTILRAHRLVTLVGPGGVGKTRIAQELAAMHGAGSRMGACTVLLGELTEPEAVGAAILEALDVGGVDAPSEETLGRVGTLDLLLVIDNCEHVIDAAASAIEAVLDGGDAARVIATSRQRLGVDGERVWTTTPLGGQVVPDGGTGDDVALFVDRAQALGVDVTADLDAVARIVRRLDGLPLAIEMAAAMLSSHGLDDLDELTGADPTVLRGPRRGAPDRQRTLADLVDWSLDGLLPSTSDAVTELAVFHGAFDRAAAAAVIGDAAATELHELVDRSLLAVDTRSGSAQYRMLWTIKSQLRRRTASGRLESSARRHAEYHLERLTDLDQMLRTDDEPGADAGVSRLYPELRTAHLWASDRDQRLAADLTTRLHMWAMSRQVGDPFRWAARLPRDASAVRPGVLAAQSQSWFYAGRIADAAALASDGLEHADGIDRLLLLESLGDIVLSRGDLGWAVDLGRRLADAAEAMDDGHFVVMGRCAQALALGYDDRATEGLAALSNIAASAPTDRGWLAYTTAELIADEHPDDAAQYLSTSIDAADTAHNRFLAGVARVAMSSLRARHGVAGDSVRDLTETIEHWQQRGMHAYLLTSLRNLVVLLDRLEQPALAARLIGAIDNSAQVPSFGAERAALSRVIDRTSDRLTGTEYEQIVEQARSAPFDQLIAELITEARQLAG